MSRLSVVVAVVVATIVGLLFLLMLETRLTLVEERRLAAGASGLAVAAAIGLLVELTLLVNRVWSRRGKLLGRVRSSGGGPTGGMIDAEEPPVPTEHAARRP